MPDDNNTSRSAFDHWCADHLQDGPPLRASASRQRAMTPAAYCSTPRTSATDTSTASQVQATWLSRLPSGSRVTAWPVRYRAA